MKNTATHGKSVSKAVKRVKSGLSGQMPEGVSRKFYLSLCERISDSFTAVGGSQREIEAMREIVDTYIIYGKEPTATDSEKSAENVTGRQLLIFLLLKPEIDKAKARSTKARLRASMRNISRQKSAKSTTLSLTPQSCPVAIETVHSENQSGEDSVNKPDDLPVPKLNRRERRELARLMRRNRTLRRHTRQSS